jgi:hypothetical protein
MLQSCVMRRELWHEENIKAIGSKALMHHLLGPQEPVQQQRQQQLPETLRALT